MTGFENYQPPGPVAAAFLNSKALARVIMGPVGSGKTTAALYAPVYVSAREPVCKDGWRRFRVFFVRDTYRNLYRSLIPSWWQHFPKDYPGSSWDGGTERPARHVLRWAQPDCEGLEFDARFIAIGSETVEQFLKGTEANMIVTDELPQIPEEHFLAMLQRVGRWPPKRLLPGDSIPHKGVIGAMNPVDVSHWTYRFLVENRPPNVEFYQQPSGLSPAAENVANLPGGRRYYEDMARTLPEWRVRRDVHGLWGPAMDGMAIYGEYRDDFHCAREPLEVADAPIHIGLDQGITAPAAVFVQRLPDLQVRVVGEVAPGRCGARAFGRHVRAWLDEHARGLPVAQVVCDPAGLFGAVREDGEMAWAETVSHELGEPIVPASTQEIQARHDAVRAWLTAGLTEQGRPAFLISPTCKLLRAGFISRYRWKTFQQGTMTRVMQKPDKSDPSCDVHDALQYVALEMEGGVHGVASGGARARRGKRQPAPRRPARVGDFSPFRLGGARMGGGRWR